MDISTYDQSLQFRYKVGFLIAHRESMAHLPMSHFHTYELSYNFKSNGNAAWERTFNHPKFGILATTILNSNRAVLGNGYGLAGRVTLPKKRWGKKSAWQWNNDMAFGIGVMERKFDLINNPKNVAIGSHANLLIILGTEIEYNQPHFSFNFGLDFTHFSNGGTVKPNLGINIPSLRVGMSWMTRKRDFIESNDVLERDDLNLYLIGIASAKNNYEFENRIYPVFGMSAHFSKKQGSRYRYLYGLDLIYSDANRRFLSSSPNQTFFETMQVGVYNAWEVEIHRFTFSIGIGAYAYNPFNPHGWFYHRIGGRIKLSESLSWHGFVRSHWAKADFFETGCSYRLRMK